MNKSVYLLRANPALTTNVKLLVSSDYSLFLESYNSNNTLSDTKYKNFRINEEAFLSERISTFYKNLPIELAYEVRNDIISDNIQSDFKNQYDSFYWSGARYIEDSKYTEEFQYNTTLKIDETNLPKYFLIFRKDGTGATDNFIKGNGSTPEDPIFFNDLKLIKTFDLTNKTPVGKLFQKNYITSNKLPRSPLELNFKEFEFSKWNGYNYHSGGNASKSFFLQEYFQNENTYYNLEKFITDGFKNNGIISSNYINISFLFDDTVSGVFVGDNVTKYYLEDNYHILKLIQKKYIKPGQYNTLQDVNGKTYYTFNTNIPYRKSWTINRYTGFYINDKIQIDQVSTYKGVKFKENTDIHIINNVFVENGVYINPLFGKYKENVPYYLKIKNKFYLVEKNEDKYVIVSDEVINGKLDDLISDAQNSIKIEFIESNNTNAGYKSYIKNVDDSFYYNENFDLYESGIFVIELYDELYTLHIDRTNKEVYINTDEYILADEKRLYRKLGNKNERYNNLVVENKDNNIIYFKIYLLEFTDIKDFDYNRTDTTYTRSEYEKNDEISYFRPGLYTENIKSKYRPKDLFFEQNYNIWIDDGTNTNTLKKLNTSNKYALSLASEYAASSDLYMLNNLDNMTDIWYTNPYVLKWGINRSINNNSYPYKINNNLTYSGINNFTSFFLGKNTNIDTLNLDYFFSLGQPINHDINDPENTFIKYIGNEYSNIVFRTLNIDLPTVNNNNNNLHSHIKFDIDFYKNIETETDYLQYILNQNVIYDKGLVSHDRFSYLQEPDSVNGHEIYFKGFNAYLNYLQHENPNIISKYKKIPARDLTGYKFSILFTPRYIRDSSESHRIGNGGIECIINKKHKNILINIYLCVPLNAITSVDFTSRDELYKTEYVKYLTYNDITGEYSWATSTLETESLTLANFIEVLSSDDLTPTGFKDGISYTIIDDVKRHYVTDISVIPTNPNHIKIRFKNDVSLKHGMWIKLNNTTLVDYDINIKVIEVINNKTIICDIKTDQTSNESVLINNISNIYVCNSTSKKPFSFDIKAPDSIHIDTNKYSIVDVDICPIKPINTSDIISDVVIDRDNDGLIEHIYNGQSITRKQIKNEYLELNDKSLKNLNSIYRYSGDYSPILKEIPIFNSDKIVKLSDDIDINIDYITVTQIDSHFYVSIHVLDDPLIIESCKNDIVYIYLDIDSSNQNPSIKFLEYTTHNIRDVKNSYISANHTEIVLSTRYNNLSFADIDVSTLVLNSPLKVYIYKEIKSNLLFDFDLIDFGINKDILITKVFTTTNPMRTIKTVNNIDSKFAMFDEHGTTVVNKNVFKSPWDLSYYYETLPNKYTQKL